MGLIPGDSRGEILMVTWEASRRLRAKGSAKLISTQSGLGPIPQGFAETGLSNNELNCMNVIESALKHRSTKQATVSWICCALLCFLIFFTPYKKRYAIQFDCIPPFQLFPAFCFIFGNDGFANPPHDLQ